MHVCGRFALLCIAVVGRVVEGLVVGVAGHEALVVVAVDGGGKGVMVAW